MQMDPRLRPHGSLLATDAEGFVVNPCDAAHLAPPWRAALDAAVAACRARFPDTLRAVLVRGSVPRGLAIPGVSDLDGVVVIGGPIPEGAEAWAEEQSDALRVHVPGGEHVELWLLSRERLLAADNHALARGVLATQCLCVWGEDLPRSLPRVRPADLIVHARELGRDIDLVLARMPTERRAEERRAWCRWVMKRVVRTGLELRVLSLGVYTRDLYPCYEAFAEGWPDRADEMGQALSWAVFPTDDPVTITPLLEDLGRFVAARGIEVWGG